MRRFQTPDFLQEVAEDAEDAHQSCSARSVSEFCLNLPIETRVCGSRRPDRPHPEFRLNPHASSPLPPAAAAGETLTALTAPSGPRPWLHRLLEPGLVALALSAVLWFFHWTVEANRGFDDWGDLDYYRLLVRGWKKGHLYIDREPAPELLALADPYDPALNHPYKMGDVSLYRGKYYLYFGVAPALTLLFPYALLTGREMLMGPAALTFVSLAFLAATRPPAMWSSEWMAAR